MLVRTEIHMPAYPENAEHAAPTRKVKAVTQAMRTGPTGPAPGEENVCREEYGRKINGCGLLAEHLPPNKSRDGSLSAFGDFCVETIAG